MGWTRKLTSKHTKMFLVFFNILGVRSLHSSKIEKLALRSQNTKLNGLIYFHVVRNFPHSKFCHLVLFPHFEGNAHINFEMFTGMKYLNRF